MNNPENTFNFSNLGIWRKIFLILRWIGLALMFFVLLFRVTFDVSGLIAGIILLFLILLVFWTHVAICKREVTNLYIIALLTLFNPISALLVLWTAIVSKRENEAAKAD
jgi:hypothetical protein